MFFMIGGTLLGLVLGLLLIWLVPQKALGWLVLVCGALATVFITPVLVSILFPFDVAFTPIISVPLALASLIPGLALATKHYRPWQVWLGLGLAAIPLIFWIIFAIGEILYPH